MDASELFMQQCRQARVNPDGILEFGRRKLKPAPPPNISEFAQTLGRVVDEEAAIAAGATDKGIVASREAIVEAARHALEPGARHFVLGTPLDTKVKPSGFEAAVFATGCFWGAEKGFWRLPGVYSTACCNVPLPAVLQGGPDDNSDSAVHVEAVRVVFDPLRIAYADLLQWFWQCHDPTQADGQGNDKGPTYQSVIFVENKEQRELAELSRIAYQSALREAVYTAEITTLVEELLALTLADPHHQQYLAKAGARAYCSARPLPVQLPAFKGGWGETRLASFAPKLGPAFWREHGPLQSSVLGAPDTQIEWSPAKEDKEFYGVAVAILGSEELMTQKANGTTESGPQTTLRWGCSTKLADEICCRNREGAERAGYFLSTTFMKAEALEASGKVEVTFCDSVTGKALFVAPRGRTWEEFVDESRRHGWPSFRDEEIVTENVRMLPNGETVSTSGTHLGHNLPDAHGNRYCINLVAIAGKPA